MTHVKILKVLHSKFIFRLIFEFQKHVLETSIFVNVTLSVVIVYVGEPGDLELNMGVHFG